MAEGQESFIYLCAAMVAHPLSIAYCVSIFFLNFQMNHSQESLCRFQNTLEESIFGKWGQICQVKNKK